MNARVKYKQLPLTEDTGTFQKRRKIWLDRLKSTVPCFAFLKLPFVRWINVLQLFEKTDQSMRHLSESGLTLAEKEREVFISVVSRLTELDNYWHMAYFK